MSCWSYTIQDLKEMRHSPDFISFFIFFLCITQHKFRATNSIKIQLPHSDSYDFLLFFHCCSKNKKYKQRPLDCTQYFILLMLVGSSHFPLGIICLSQIFFPLLICRKNKETDRRIIIRKKQRQKNSTKKGGKN